LSEKIPFAAATKQKEGIEPSFFVGLFFVGVGVELMMDVAEAFVGYMGVDLCCGDVAVAQKFLDATQVNALV